MHQHVENDPLVGRGPGFVAAILVYPAHAKRRRGCPAQRADGSISTSAASADRGFWRPRKKRWADPCLVMDVTVSAEGWEQGVGIRNGPPNRANRSRP